MASTDDGILERRATSPMGTACLIVAFFMLLGAIIFPILEIGEIRAGNVGQRPSEDIATLSRRDRESFTRDVQGKIDELETASGTVEAETGIGVPAEEEGAGTATDGDDTEDTGTDTEDTGVDDTDNAADETDTGEQ